MTLYRVAFTYPGARGRTQQGQTWSDRSRPVSGLLPAQEDLSAVLHAGAAILRRGGTVAIQQAQDDGGWLAVYAGVDVGDAQAFADQAEYFAKRREREGHRVG